MKSIFFATLFFASTIFAANLSIQPGESVTVKASEEDTTVTCAGNIPGGSSGSTKKARKEKPATCGFNSDSACRGSEVGALCTRDGFRGTCIGSGGIPSGSCSCIVN